MQLVWLGVAIAATVGYHVVLKLTPAGANPYLSLAVTYTMATVAFACAYVAMPGRPRRFACRDRDLEERAAATSRTAS